MSGEEQNTASWCQSHLYGRDQQECINSTQRKTHLANSQDIINVQALEQGPHGEIDIDQTSAEVKPTRETRNDLQVGIAAVTLRASIELDKISSPGGRVCEDLGDLKRVRLYIFGKTRPGKSEVVPHEVVDRVTGDKGWMI